MYEVETERDFTPDPNEIGLGSASGSSPQFFDTSVLANAPPIRRPAIPSRSTCLEPICAEVVKTRSEGF